MFRCTGSSESNEAEANNREGDSANISPESLTVLSCGPLSSSGNRKVWSGCTRQDMVQDSSELYSFSRLQPDHCSLGLVIVAVVVSEPRHVPGVTPCTSYRRRPRLRAGGRSGDCEGDGASASSTLPAHGATQKGIIYRLGSHHS